LTRDGEQNDLLWTAAGATDLDLAGAPNGGDARDVHVEAGSLTVMDS